MREKGIGESDVLANEHIVFLIQTAIIDHDAVADHHFVLNEYIISDIPLGLYYRLGQIFFEREKACSFAGAHLFAKRLF